MTILMGTGHRPNKLGGYGDDILQRLILLAKKGILRAHKEHGPITLVISGMALGWDQALARAAVQWDLPFHAAVPFAGQESAWPAKARSEYYLLLEQAEGITTVSGGGYSATAMQKRNQWMVDHSDIILALWNGSPGGTANCLKVVREDQIVINLWEEWKGS